MEANEARARVIELKRTIAQHESDLDRAQADLKTIEDACAHDWGRTVYDPIVRDGFSYDASGGGSDWRPGGFCPREEKKRWRRECATCGKVEFTEKESVEEKRTPKF